MKKLKLLRCPKTKRSRYGLRKKNWQFPRFPSFRFYPKPKIENSEISEICFFLQILTVVINQDLKTIKIWTERKTEGFRYDLHEKIKFLRFPSFRFCPTPKIENFEISEDFFISNIGNGCNSRFKNVKEINWDKI